MSAGTPSLAIINELARIGSIQLYVKEMTNEHRHAIPGNHRRVPGRRRGQLGCARLVGWIDCERTGCAEKHSSRGQPVGKVRKPDRARDIRSRRGEARSE